MPKETIIVISLFAFILFIVIVSSIVKTRNKKKREAERAAAAAAAAEAKKRKVNKIKNHATIQKWANEITQGLYNIISNSPHYDWEFDFRPYCQDIDVGLNLQNVYLPNLQEHIKQDGHKILFSYNFSANEVPELTFEERPLFSKTLAQMVKKLLSEKGVNTSICSKLTTVTQTGSRYEDWDEKAIFALTYKRKKVENGW